MRQIYIIYLFQNFNRTRLENFLLFTSISELFRNRLLMRSRKLDKLIRVIEGGVKLHRNRAADCPKASSNGLEAEYIG